MFPRAEPEDKAEGKDYEDLPRRPGFLLLLRAADVPEPAIAEALPFLVAGDDPGFMNKVALLTQPPRPKKPPPEKTEDSDAKTDKTDKTSNN